MPKFAVYGKVVGTKYLGEVEAADAEEAKEKAIAAASVMMCHQCSGECEDAEIDEDGTVAELVDE